MKQAATRFILSLGLIFCMTPSLQAGGTVIANGKTVSMHYSLSVGGEVVDSTFEKDPITFVFGEEVLMPGFQKNIEGLSPGDEKKFTVEPADAFGERDPEATAVVPKEQLPPGDVEPGMFLTGSGPDQEPIRAVVASVDGDEITLDFNHPLAGKQLEFSVKVLEVS